MDGLCFVAGCSPTVRLGRRRLLLRPRTIADYGMFEAEMLKPWGGLLDVVRIASCVFARNAARQRTVVRLLLEQTYRRHRFVTLADTLAWLSTWHGGGFALWLAVRDNDPAYYTLERVCALAAAADWGEIARAIQVASAEDERMLAEWFAPAGAGPQQPIPWALVYRRLAQPPWCLAADQVGRLTLYQLGIYLGEDNEWSPRVEFASAAEMEAWRRNSRAALDRAVEHLLAVRPADTDADTGIELGSESQC